MAEPILRWAGGKRQLLDDILDRFPPKYEFNEYYEPFFGGGAVFFELEPSNGHINDVNENLMNFYSEFRRNLNTIIDRNKDLDDELIDCPTEDEQKEFYYECREEFNEVRKSDDPEDRLDEAVLFLFLNRTCWNGLYRTNEDGDFNVPMKRGPILTKSIEKKLRKGARVLQNTSITSKDFGDSCDSVGEGDLVFLDPPYMTSSKKNQFDQYSRHGFSERQQEEVRDLALELDNRGAYVMLTNDIDAKPIYTSHDEFMSSFGVTDLEGKRRINSDSSQRSDLGVNEVMVTNIPMFWKSYEEQTQSGFDKFR